MLSRHSEIARHVQKLVIRPDHAEQSRFRQYAPADGSVISTIIKQIAVRLDALHTFVWDAEDLPPDDDMWFTLRIS